MNSPFDVSGCIELSCEVVRRGFIARFVTYFGRAVHFVAIAVYTAPRVVVLSHFVVLQGPFHVPRTLKVLCKPFVEVPYKYKKLIIY